MKYISKILLARFCPTFRFFSSLKKGKELVKVLLLLLLTGFTQDAFAQGFAKGDINVGAGIGLTHLNKLTIKRNINDEKFKSNFTGTLVINSLAGTNPIALRYEYALSKFFGLGVNVCWWNVRFSITNNYDQGSGQYVLHRSNTFDYRLSSLSFGIRPNYHFPLANEKGDLYVGLAVGLTKNNITVDMPDAHAYTEASAPFTLYVAPVFGYKYFFTRSFAFYAEVGYDKGALASIGLNMRFRPTRIEDLLKN